MSCTLRIVVLTVLTSLTPPLFARKATVADRDAAARQSLLDLRYSEKKGGTQRHRLRQNLSRDCEGARYSQRDRDLTVKAILASYPVQAISDYIDDESSICPSSARALAEIIDSKYKDIKVGKKNAEKWAIHYLSSFSDFRQYPWSSHMWSLRPLLQFRNRCGKGEALSLIHI